MAATVSVVPTAVDAGELVAERVWDRYEAVDGVFVLAVPAGRTPATTYASLAAGAATRRLDLGRLRLALFDEFVGTDGALCPADAHYSCRRSIGVALVEPLREVAALHDDQIWCPDPADPSSYDIDLRRAGGIDVVIVASGATDGHVAFNPAGTALSTVTRVVELSDATRADNLGTFPDFDGIDEVPTHGVSMGLGTIAGAREAVLVLLGSDKRRSFGTVTAATAFDPEWPATVIHACGRPWIVADEAATGHS